MTISWSDYVSWTHETAMRRADKDTEPRELAELLIIWGLGLGGEFAEFMVEMLGVTQGTARDFVNQDFSAKAREEAGDVLWYLARLYQDTGNALHEASAPRLATLREVASAVKDVVECLKKALRKEGRAGLIRLTISESEQQKIYDPSIKMEKIGLSGRREEFGVLLDRALSTFEAWLVARGSSLSEVCELNQEKLRARKAEGTISVQGERLGELLNEKVGIPMPRRSDG